MSTYYADMVDSANRSHSNICSNRVLVDYRISETTVNELIRMGMCVYKTTPHKALYNEVNGHADMQIHFINKKAFCAPEVYEYYKSLNLSDIELVSGSKPLSSNYPNDVLYNVCSLGNYAILRPLSTAIEILSEYHNLKKEILNAKQGYAKCSICVVDEESAITADNGMYKLLKENNINILKVSEGFIRLYGMQGFIGGASGLINKNTLCFNGNINTHPDSKNIISFCKNVNVDVVSLNDGELWDIGSILLF